jgi:hypothetical protein
MRDKLRIPGSTRPDHLFRPGQRDRNPEAERLLTQRRAVLVRGLGDFRSLVVADFGATAVTGISERTRLAWILF